MPEPKDAAVDNSEKTTPTPSTDATDTTASEDTELEADIRDAMGVVEETGDEQSTNAAATETTPENGAQTPSSDSASDTAQQKDASTSEGSQEQENDATGAAGEDKSTTPTQSDDTGATGEATAPTVSRLDKRIVNIALKNAALYGTDVDAQALQERVKGLPFDQKKQVLEELLEDNRQLRGSEEPTEEDVEALAEAKAEEMLIEQELAEAEAAQAHAQEAWHETLGKLISEHPELDESSDKYDAILAQTLELAVLDGTDADGNPVPRYSVDPQKVFAAILKARTKAQEENARQTQKNRTRALSGAVSGATSGAGSTGTLTWEDMEDIRRNDPERYEKMIENGELPSDE